ncbi:MAG: beta-galactosidase, partial [Firmicutes bacterium]|nr:beta-galactosidase [Bacillota bacterium]
MKAELKWLEDPEVFRVNRLDAHSDHITYASLDEAVQKRTSLRQSLDGTWKFQWSEAPAKRPEDFWKEGYDLSGFGTIQVPGHMEIQGHGQIQYINKLYPWDGHKEILPPQVDWDDNPIGSYVCEFDLDPALVGKDVRISFQGIEKAAYIWLNGQFVGYCEDTFTPSDFDLTPYIKPSGNRLCVEVYKHCSGSWIEGQDFFRFSGIFRSVFLYTKPIVEDVWFQTVLHEDNTSGSLKIRLLSDADQVAATIRHPQDGVLFNGALDLSQEGEYSWSQVLDFDSIKAWDYGTPELYQVILTVTKGETTEYIPYNIGFRRVELGEDKVMYLNGKRLIINGVNRHEWNAETGRVITVKDMEDAMEVFLANNINAVRTSHYPNRTEWYHMCDEQGIYMMDETNLESHGSWQVGMTVCPDWNVPGSYPEWKECVLDRAKSMLERDKNHVSILFWSCGNEAFCGSNIVAMADYFRSTDPSRLIHYEGAYWPRGVVNGTPNSPHWRPEYETVSDMETRMYATPWEVREYLENDPPKPYLNCEYMHNMGNSLGGMESYVSMIDEFPLYQGGFIWDYMDQALWYTNVNGERVLGYGGDFGERQSDYNFSGNGIVTADGLPKPCMQELRYWHSTLEERAAFDAKNEVDRDMSEMLPMMTSEVPLTISHGDGALGVKGENFEVLFGGQGPVSMRWNGKE